MKKKKKRKREAMFSIVTTKAEKNKSKVPESFQTDRVQTLNPFFWKKDLKKIHGI